MRVLMNYHAPFCIYMKATKPRRKKIAAMTIPVTIDF
jgi:hypothetical protein